MYAGHMQILYHFILGTLGTHGLWYSWRSWDQSPEDLLFFCDSAFCMFTHPDKWIYLEKLPIYLDLIFNAFPKTMKLWLGFALWRRTKKIIL